MGQKFVISEEAIKATTKCKKGMSCLKKDVKDLCQVDHRVGKEVYLKKCLCSTRCSYRESFGIGIYCSCPVRTEF